MSTQILPAKSNSKYFNIGYEYQPHSKGIDMRKQYFLNAYLCMASIAAPNRNIDCVTTPALTSIQKLNFFFRKGKFKQVDTITHSLSFANSISKTNTWTHIQIVLQIKSANFRWVQQFH